jgi:uncharacterized protein (DUF1697 family)
LRLALLGAATNAETSAVVSGDRSDEARLASVMCHVEALRAATIGPEVVRADGRQLYIVYPNGLGRSRLTNTAIEKKLGTRGTGRNWNTVLRLGALAKG